MEAYRRAFIATGSFEPVKHVMAGVFLMAFGMEHYFHHKYHAHAEASHADHPPAAAAPAASTAKPAVDAGLPPAAAAALAEPLPGNVDDLTEEIKSLRAEIATLRQGIRVAADAASEAKKTTQKK